MFFNPIQRCTGLALIIAPPHASFSLHVQQTFPPHPCFLACCRVLVTSAPTPFPITSTPVTDETHFIFSCHASLFSQLKSSVTDKLTPHAHRLCEGAHHFPPRPSSSYTIFTGRLVHNDGRLLYAPRFIRNDAKPLYKWIVPNDVKTTLVILCFPPPFSVPIVRARSVRPL